MLEQVCQLARNAGDAIMEVYDGNQPINVASKKDDSPVTAADIAAHKVIVSGLQALDRIPDPLRGGPAVLGSAPALAALLAGRPAGRHQRVY